MSARENPPPRSKSSSIREVGWVAREARALAGSDDEQRRAAFLARKRALLDYVEATDEAAQTVETESMEMD